MLLERTSLNRSTERGIAAVSSPSKPDDPLTCMIYFFTSQMSRNLQTAPTASTSKSSQMATQAPEHRLDTLLSKIGVHASLSPLITQFERFPVEIPDALVRSKWWTKPRREATHDIMLLVRFRSKRAREEWIETRQWKEFMLQTEAEGVFRRMPHVRCAQSLKGLRDPIEILSV